MTKSQEFKKIKRITRIYDFYVRNCIEKDSREEAEELKRIQEIEKLIGYKF